MRDRSFYGREIQFSSQQDQEDFERTVLLDTAVWKPASGSVIGKGTFHVVREAVLENLRTGERKNVVRKKVHHPVASKKLALLEAFRWWKLQKLQFPVAPFCAVDPTNLDFYTSDFRNGYGSYQGKTKVFDTNSSPKACKEIASFLQKKPLMNPSEVIQQIRNVIQLFQTTDINPYTDEVFFLLLREEDAALQVVLGDLKMLFDESPPSNVNCSVQSLFRFLSEKAGIPLSLD